MNPAAATGIGDSSMPSRYPLWGWAASVLAIRILVRSAAYFPAADLAGSAAGYAINFILSLAWA